MDRIADELPTTIGVAVMPAPPRYPPIDFGPLPVDLINAILGTELEPSRVRLSAQAHRHIAEDHPDDYATCIAALPLAIAEPSFVGQGPGHTRNFELVRRVARADGPAVLVAIGLEMDDKGEYRVRTCYLISAGKVDERRRARRLLSPHPT